MLVTPLLLRSEGAGYSWKEGGDPLKQGKEKSDECGVIVPIGRAPTGGRDH